MPEDRPTVALFVTCLVDLMRPTVGFAALKLLEDAGCVVDVPPAQTCCGQPAYNSGDRADTAAIARQVITAFARFDYVVAPSGSCAAMIRLHYPRLFDDEAHWKARVEALAERTFELTSFLTEVMRVNDVGARHAGTVTYHDTCSGLRELGIRDQPRTLLGAVDGLVLEESADAEACCGFGGTFCVKYADISERIVDAKVDTIVDSGADILLGGDLGCLLNIAGRLQRRGAPLRVRHVAEILAGMTATPPIGESQGAK